MSGAETQEKEKFKPEEAVDIPGNANIFIQAQGEFCGFNCRFKWPYADENPKCILCNNEPLVKGAKSGPKFYYFVRTNKCLRHFVFPRTEQEITKDGVTIVTYLFLYCGNCLHAEKGRCNQFGVLRVVSGNLQRYDRCSACLEQFGY